jgi:ElaB/YqjD/DUF883 family membrane-anchored ribosome-binding protein
MAQTVVDQASEFIEGKVQQASRATGAVADAFQDGLGEARRAVKVARRAVKQGGEAAEEFLNDTTRRVKRHPMQTIAITFAVGATVGAVFAWATKRR